MLHPRRSLFGLLGIVSLLGSVGVARADVLEKDMTSGGKGTALLVCKDKVFGLTPCTGQPFTIGSIDLQTSSPELVGEEVTADLTLHGTIAGTLDTLVFVVGGHEVRLGDATVNMTPNVTFRAGEKVDVSFHTDVDGYDYQFPGKPQATLDKFRLSLMPSLATRLAWRTAAGKTASTITGYLSLYQSVKRLPEIVKLGDKELGALEEKALADATAMLEATGTGLTWPQLLYPDDHPEEKKRGTIRGFRDMPKEWATALRVKPDLVRVLTIFANVRAVRKGIRVLTPADADASLTQAQALLDGATTDGYAWTGLLEKWLQAGAADLEKTKQDLDKLLADVETAKNPPAP